MGKLFSDVNDELARSWIDLGAMGIKVRGSGRASDWNINVIFNTKRLDELGKYRGEKMVKELSPRVLQCL